MSRYKIVCMGGMATGKTTYLKYITDGIPLNENKYQDTTSITSYTPINELENIQLVDIPGTARYTWSMPGYLKDSLGYIFFVDLTRDNTVDDIERWISIATEANGSCPAILIGTKIDCRTFVHAYDDMAHNVERAKNIAKEHHILFFEISVKNQSKEQLRAPIQELIKKIEKINGVTDEKNRQKNIATIFADHLSRYEEKIKERFLSHTAHSRGIIEAKKHINSLKTHTLSVANFMDRISSIRNIAHESSYTPSDLVAALDAARDQCKQENLLRRPAIIVDTSIPIKLDESSEYTKSTEEIALGYKIADIYNKQLQTFASKTNWWHLFSSPNVHLDALTTTVANLKNGSFNGSIMSFMDEVNSIIAKIEHEPRLITALKNAFIECIKADLIKMNNIQDPDDPNISSSSSSSYHN